jgi:hypothetical protein
MFCFLFLTAALLVDVPITNAQTALDLLYTSTSHEIQFGYASAWDATFDDRDPEYVLMEFAWQDSTMLIAFYAPDAVAELSDYGEDLIIVSGNLRDDIEYRNVRMITLNGTLAAEARADDWFHLIITLEDGRFGLVSATIADGSIAEQRDFVKEIAATYRTLTVLQDDPEPIQLVNYAENYRDAMAELQQLRLVASGGGLVFEEDYAFMEREGYFAVPVGRRSPRTNVVMSAEITIIGLPRFGKFNNEQGCGIMARVTSIDEMINGGVEVGLFPSNMVALYDFNNPANNGWDTDIQYDHTTSIYLMMILHGTDASIFVNGMQVSERPVRIREVGGMYALNSASDGDLRCEWHNIWVYEIPEFREGFCEVVSVNGANLRAGPGTDFARSGSLASNTPQQVNGYAQSADGYRWYHLQSDAWVREDVVYIQGDCTSLPETAR